MFKKGDKVRCIDDSFRNLMMLKFLSVWVVTMTHSFKLKMIMGTLRNFGQVVLN